MQCKFEVLNVPWEKRQELLDHQCVGLKERTLSCERSQQPKADQNVVKEMFDEVR